MARPTHKKNYKSGFTIIEMIIVTMIITIISAVVLSSYPAFSSRMALARLAREMALTVRQAQAYGIGVRESTVGANRFANGYGVTVDMVNPREYVLFSDQNNIPNGLFDPGFGCGEADSECLELYTFSGREYIDNICVFQGSENVNVNSEGACWLNESGQRITDLHISFARPNPEAVIQARDLQFGGPAITNGVAAKIFLRSTRVPDQLRVVRVWNTGQVSVQNE